jgi:hypothetical protein
VTCHEMDGVISLRSGTSGLPPEAAKHVAGTHMPQGLRV